MATIPEIHLMKPTAFSDGTDTYPGLRRVTVRKNPQAVYRGRTEGNLTPTYIEPIETDEPPVQGTLVFMSHAAMLALAGASIDSATCNAKNPINGEDVTPTWTNMRIQSADGAIEHRQAGEWTLNYEATAYAAPSAS